MGVGAQRPFCFFQAEDGIRDVAVTGVQTCALPICGILSGSGVEVGSAWPGAGIKMISPGRIGQAFGAKLFSANSTSKSTSYVSARSKQVSPSLIVYSNGPDGVTVTVGAEVLVMVGVSDAVGLGVMGVTVGVALAVRVAEEKSPSFGAFGPVNQTTSKMIPIRTNRIAIPHTINGIIRWRFL